MKKRIETTVSKTKLGFIPLEEAFQQFMRSKRFKDYGDGGNNQDSIVQDFINIMRQVCLLERWSLQDMFQLNNKLFQRDPIEMANLFDDFVGKMTKLGKVKELEGARQVYDYSLFSVV